MNVYDFDGTIYAGDSTVDFYLYCAREYPRILKVLPGQVAGFCLYKLKKLNKTQWKERFYGFLRCLPDPEKAVEDFRRKNIGKIKPWYLAQKADSDVIISASPEFLVRAFGEELGVAEVIASKVDIRTGKTEGENCKGEEKVRRFRERFGDAKIDRFYSDNASDAPLAAIAEESFRVRGSKVTPLT